MLEKGLSFLLVYIFPWKVHFFKLESLEKMVKTSKFVSQKRNKKNRKRILMFWRGKFDLKNRQNGGWSRCEELLIRLTENRQIGATFSRLVEVDYSKKHHEHSILCKSLKEEKRQKKKPITIDKATWTTSLGETWLKKKS